VIDDIYLQDVRRVLHNLKNMADRALAQVEDEAFFEPLGAEENSLALIVKHLAGNLRSRWSQFLTTDGEKPDRHRDREFEREPGDTRESLMRRWEEGWAIVFDELAALTMADLERTVRIRREPHPVVQALNRQLQHSSYHIGQIVLLAKHHVGDRWQTLSIPKRGSDQYNAEMSRKFGG
jgi:uncharacterized damage-inducible protein DinB